MGTEETMRNKRNFISACLGGLAGVALCAQAPAGNAMARTPSPVSATAEDAGKTISLTTGQSLEVRLQAQPGTGASWSVAPSSTRLLKFEGMKSEGAADIPGGSETQVLSFTAIAAGKGMLMLDYGRAWEKTAPPQKTFSMTVSIGE
jgi:inhibitor of cysteine peptidase